MAHSVTIAGREFRGITDNELPAAQEDFLLGQMRFAGALDTMVGAGKKPEAEAERLLTKLMVSGRISHVLAGCLTEVGKQWTLEEANRNAARFASTTKAEDKAAMRSVVVGFVISFFVRGRAKAFFSKSSKLKRSAE